MKVTIISDTHGQHEELVDLSGDVLIHCGDMEGIFSSEADALSKIDSWFARQDFEHILFVGGNHDFKLEQLFKLGATPLSHATFLHDTYKVIDGFKFYGSSWVPQLGSHAFYASEQELRQVWRKIPQDTDVLITHTPPAGRLDQSSRGLKLGCTHLAKRVKNIRPKLHCFGHVHASAGQVTEDETIFLNASSVNSGFSIAYPPYEFEF